MPKKGTSLQGSAQERYVFARKTFQVSNESSGQDRYEFVRKAIQVQQIKYPRQLPVCKEDNPRLYEQARPKNPPEERS